MVAVTANAASSACANVGSAIVGLVCASVVAGLATSARNSGPLTVSPFAGYCGWPTCETAASAVAPLSRVVTDLHSISTRAGPRRASR
jgi:hypothetical protein